MCVIVVGMWERVVKGSLLAAEGVKSGVKHLHMHVENC